MVFNRLRSALFLLVISQCFCNMVRAQKTGGQNDTAGTTGMEPALPKFGDTVQIAGGMTRTDQDFQDGLALDILSPKNRTVVVTQNTKPLAAQFVTGANGGPFVALQNYSYIIQTSDKASDLIAKIEIPYDLNMLKTMNIQEGNTYVGKLAVDQKSWVVDDDTRNVHRIENNTRIIKMTSIDGEYMLLGRQPEDISNIFLQYGQGPTRTANLTGGPGLQEAEFIDGLRFSVQSNEPMSFNVDIDEGINPNTLPPDTVPLNSYSWVINSTNSKASLVAQMLVPFNRAMLVALKPAGSSPSTMLTVYKRPLNATSGQFQAVNAELQVVRELSEDRISIPMMTQLDGRYTILVTQPKMVGETGAMALSPIQIPATSQMGTRGVTTTEGVLKSRGTRAMRERRGVGSSGRRDIQ